MMQPTNPRTGGPSQRGFTLIELLIALGIMAVLTSVLMAMFAPFLNFKARIDTEAQMRALAQTLQQNYEQQALRVDSTNLPEFAFVSSAGAPVALRSSTVNAVMGGTECNSQATILAQLPVRPQAGADRAELDGFGKPFCIFVSAVQSRVQDGVTVPFHTITLLSTGPNGVIDPGTVFDPATGVLTQDPDGDDRISIVVDGFSIQQRLVSETFRRMGRIVTAYETYFSTSYVNSSQRDTQVDYFYADDAGDPNDFGDLAGRIGRTGGGWGPASNVASVLGPLGLSGEVSSAHGTPIEVGNTAECDSAGVCVKSPLTLGQPRPPYTALVRASIPSGSPTPAYVYRTAIGAY